MKELVNLRKEKEKHYLNDDGTITAYLYDEAIHYLDKETYEEIDNTIIEKEKYYMNHKNDFQVEFYKEHFLVSVSTNKYYMNILLENSNKLQRVETKGNKITFKEIIKDVDLEYEIIGRKLKETFKLNQKGLKNVTFKINTNLELEKSDQEIIAKKDGVEHYRFDAPFLKDAKNNYFYNCEISLEKKDNCYLLTYLLDQDWLEEAVYPVIIDPTISINDGTKINDTYIYNGDANVDRNKDPYLKIGVDSNGIVYRSLIKFDLPTIGTAAQVIEAKAYLNSYGNDYYPVGTENKAKNKTALVHQMTKDWTETTAHWNELKNSFNAKVETYTKLSRTIATINGNVQTNSISTNIFDVTNIVKKWYSGTPNYGLMFKWEDEVKDNDVKEYYMYSKNNSETSISNPKPYLIIKYKYQNGLLNYMSYHTFELTTGSSYINNFNGNLTNVFYVNKTIGSNIPLSLNLVYNTDSAILNEDFKVAKGWRFNYDEKISKEIIDENIYYKYVSGSGEIHYFYKNNENKYVDEDGLGLSLSIKYLDNNQDVKEFILTDKNGNNYYFSKNEEYYLNKLELTDKSCMLIKRDENQCINEIIDDKNNILTIHYLENKIIVSSNTEESTISIENNKIVNILTRVGNVSIHYNELDIIKKVIDVTGTSLIYDYYETLPYRIKKVTHFGLNNEEGKSKQFSYDFNSTTVTDNKNNKMRYTFNNLGNTVNTVLLSKDGTLKNSYGFAEEYVEALKQPTTNKVTERTLPIKYNGNTVFEGDLERQNMIVNSNFAEGTKDWKIKSFVSSKLIDSTPFVEIITLDSNEKALKIKSKSDTSIYISQEYPISIKKGDTFTLSFWYKNEGSHYRMQQGNSLQLNFVNYGEQSVSTEPQKINLNRGVNEWQFYTKTFISEYHYNTLGVQINSITDVNNFYITNLTLVKESGSFKYNYDSNGNLISVKDVLGNKSKMKYNENNQLISSFDCKGNHFQYEYDKVIPDRILKGISPTGISNEISYDTFGNPIKTTIRNTNSLGNKINGNYYIRARGTNKYLFPDILTKYIKLREDKCNHYAFYIEKIDNMYTIKPTILSNYSLTNINSIMKLSLTSSPIKYNLIRNNNASYYIRIGNQNLYLKNVNDQLCAASLEEENPNFEFYLEDVTNTSFISESAEYTEDGKYIKSMKDALGNKTTYETDQTTGLLTSLTNANNQTTSYTYNEKYELTSISTEGKTINYQNENNLIKKITSGEKNYSYDYNNFLNPLKVQLNNQTLIENAYEENDGNLKSITFGNQDTINYTYDDLERIKTVIKGTDTYNYSYNTCGEIKEIKNSDSTQNIKFYYDYAQRLSKVLIDNKLTMQYEYDANDNIAKELHSYNDSMHQLLYEYNEDDNITKIFIDDKELNFSYDYLGRISSKNINNHLKTEYHYKGCGNKTSLIVDKIKIDEDIYQFTYDNLYNITKIMKNNEVNHAYTYDNRNQLISDNNYEINRKYIYTYNEEGNISKREIKDIETNTTISRDTFEYTNTLWEDQLTKVNEETITYDAIGNPLTIGNKVLTWNNGRELTSYQDHNLEVDYTYNVAGLRTEKKVNGVKTKYYLEDEDILVEEREGDVLYYIRDDSGELVGVMRNGEIYYYQKNYQGDIEGIYDSSYKLIVKYRYDAYGNVLSIEDNEGKEITDNNHIGRLNPYRYRSYYYDEETNLYYLKSRYYNPLWGRFINADCILGGNSKHLGYNLFVYANNNPITYIDDSGDFAITGTIVGAVIGSAVLLGYGAVIATKNLLTASAPIITNGVDALNTAVYKAKERAAAAASASIAATKAAKAKKNSSKKKDKEKYTVYKLVDSSGKAQYVGMTSDEKKREQAHKSNPFRKELTFEREKWDIETKLEARVWEQYYIEYYQTLNRNPLNPISNQINSIRPGSEKYNRYIETLKRNMYGEVYVGGE